VITLPGNARQRLADWPDPDITAGLAGLSAWKPLACPGRILTV
jgi:hypothetical protein